MISAHRAQAVLSVFGKKVAQAAAHFFAGANHGMDIAHDLIRHADILADHLDQSFIWPARVKALKSGFADLLRKYPCCLVGDLFRACGRNRQNPRVRLR